MGRPSFFFRLFLDLVSHFGDCETQFTLLPKGNGVRVPIGRCMKQTNQLGCSHVYLWTISIRL